MLQRQEQFQCPLVGVLGAVIQLLQTVVI
jgi:hypothetical protein